MSSKRESQKLRARAAAANFAGELANARQMAQQTGRSMLDWITQPTPAAPHAVHCEPDHDGCGWAGMSDALHEEDGTTYCPRCGNEVFS